MWQIQFLTKKKRRTRLYSVGSSNFTRLLSRNKKDRVVPKKWNEWIINSTHTHCNVKLCLGVDDNRVLWLELASWLQFMFFHPTDQLSAD